MIKFEVCKCIRPFNEFFEIDKYYVLYPSKSNGKLTAYVHPTQGYPIVPRGFVRTSVDFHRIYFEPIAVIQLKNYKEVNEMKKKSIEEILEIIQTHSVE